MRNYTSRHYASGQAYRLREAATQGYRKKSGGITYNLTHPFVNGVMTFNDFPYIKTGPHDLNSWNFTAKTVSVNFNNGDIPTVMVHMIETMLGLPLNVKDDVVTLRLGGTDVVLPISGDIPVRQILNNILQARGVNKDLSTKGLIHGRHVNTQESDLTWGMVTGLSTSRVTRYGEEREFSRKELSFICPIVDDGVSYADYRAYLPDPREVRREAELAARREAERVAAGTTQNGGWYHVYYTSGTSNH